MLSILSVVLPIFALILAGWVVRRLGVLGPQATTELNRFVVHLALPALLFDIVVHARWVDVWQPGFVGAFGLGTLLTFLATLAVRLRGRRHLADATIDGLNAGYANAGFVGFPLGLAVFGRDALPLTLIATVATACVLFAVAIVLIEAGQQAGKGRGPLVAKVGGALLRNPLLVAPVAGTLASLLGLGVAPPVESFLRLMGGAAAPCALVALGLFMAEPREAAARSLAPMAALVGCKLLLQPAVTWVLASLVFGLPPLLTHVAVLLSALPTGTGPFMLAEFYRRDAATTAGVILVSTVLSVFTVSLYLAFAV